VKVITADSVSSALAQGLDYILTHGKEELSRNGPVLVAPTPVTTVYTHPWRRVLFSPTRDANPYFHCMESLWLLAGRRDLEFPKKFNSRFGNYSDDGVTVRGSYGYRWRNWFGYDQLKVIIAELCTNPASRRCVLAMWDASELAQHDQQYPLSDAMGDLLENKSNDLPCNTHIYFRVRDGVLDMTVCNRSNDLLWGLAGANAVHMSFLQEYMATMIGIPVGTYFQMSNNYHLYTDILSRKKAEVIIEECKTENRVFKEYVPLVTNPDIFDAELDIFMSSPALLYNYENTFLRNVALPMYAAWDAKRYNLEDAKSIAAQIADDAWRIACVEWLERIEVRRNGK
jgi:thymidylate synthase